MQQKTIAASTTVVAVIIAIIAGLIGGYLFGSGALTEQNQAPKVTILGGQLESNSYVVTVGMFDIDGNPSDLVIKWNKPLGTTVDVLDSSVEGGVYNVSFLVKKLPGGDITEVSFTVADGDGATTRFSVKLVGPEVLVTID